MRQDGATHAEPAAASETARLAGPGNEYILMMHFMDEVDGDLQARLTRYLRRQQTEAGGWPLYPGGEIDVSCSVKAYYALIPPGPRT